MRRRRVPRREPAVSVDALGIEGGLLSPEWLSKVAQLTAGRQGETEYHVPKGLNLRDEIGRYWRIAQAHWGDFAKGVAAKAEPRAIGERFVRGLLTDAFGFGTLAKSEVAHVGERTFPIGFSALGGRVPVVIAPAGGGLDTPSATFGDGGRKRSAFGLAQEYLNAEEAALWGIVCDGTSLRILRDNASLTRPAWIEADLARIFTEERYADFAALWLLAHETRYGKPDQPVTDCALEAWRNAGREEGTRAREHLRTGVEQALIALGQGFLGHPGNEQLRADLRSDAFTKDEYKSELLRLVYRLIFLLTVEERGLLHPDGTDENAKALYAGGYSLRHLRERSVKRGAHDRFSDLWDALKIVFRGLATGEPRLGLPALAGLFATGQCRHLDAARLENRALLLAMFKLSWLRDEAGLARVNWRDMGPEELGSVYESLLELVPQIGNDARKFCFATGGETKGNARKTTGSYYTPDGLVQVLLDSALEPVVAETIAKNPEHPVDALLDLSIVDPACGSGHFLLAAARRLAAHVARLQASGTPSAGEYRHALRQVVGRCIYGVDLNPMAVELCKVSLWMEAVEPGLPLTFLNAHIQHGNALLGTTPELMAKGIPDAAWDPIEGDDRKIASALKKQNKKERTELSFDFAMPPESTYIRLGEGARAVDDASDESLDALEQKAEAFRELVASSAYSHQRFVTDLWCSAFVWRKEPGALRDLAPTDARFRSVQQDFTKASPALRAEVATLVAHYQLFHWHLAFPQVFARGGFDVVLGNPPWERVKLHEQEFFASRHDAIANAPNAAERKKLIAALPENDAQLWKAWCAASRLAEGESHLIRDSGRYPLCGKGDVNTYAVFAEHNRRVLAPRGRAGFIVPAGIVTDDTTKEFFADLTECGRLAAVYHFENEAKIFPDVHNAYRFVLMTLGEAQRADLVFFARQVSTLKEAERHVSLAPSDFAELNPNTRTCPTFRSRRDANINLALYQRAGVLWRQHDPGGNPWGLRFMAMLHMTNDSRHFRTRGALELGRSYLPLLEAKMIWHFDHRFATYEGATQANLNKGTLPQATDAQHANPWYEPTPEYWVADDEVATRLAGVWTRRWLLGWRDITGTEKQRTVISAVIPKVGVGNTASLMFAAADPVLVACLYGSLCSFALDYAARQKVGGTHLNYVQLKQLPVFAPSGFGGPAPWQLCEPLSTWLLPRVLELTYTAWALKPFARDVGYDGPPFRWDPERRFLLRCELDAAFFHLYGISRDDTDYVMDTFPIVRKNDEKAHGEYRTKRVILDIYDAMVEAARTGKPYETRLDPPPADPRVAHPDTRGVKVQ